MTIARPALAEGTACDVSRGDAVLASRGVSQGARRTPVMHPHAALAFFTSGRALMEQRGRWQLEPGALLVVPAGEPHRLLEARGSEYWGVGVSAASFAAEGGAALLEPFERVREGAAAVVQIPAERQGFLESLFRELAAPPPSGSATGAAVRRSLLTLILSEVERASAAERASGALPSGGGRGQAGSNVVSDSLRFIERNCLRRLTLGDVAAAVGRSPAYVTTALTRATGRSAVQWIVSGRMAEARRLLLHSGEGIEAIAERVGYADATHFVRMFRREHGVPPGAWRAAHAR